MKIAFVFPGQGSQNVGMGKVLSGLIKRIDGNAKRYNVEDTETLEQMLSEIEKK